MTERDKAQTRKDVALHRAQERFARGRKEQRRKEVNDFQAMVGSFLDDILSHFREGEESMARALAVMPESDQIKSHLDYYRWGARAVSYMQHQLEIRCNRVRRMIDKNNKTNVRV